MFRTYAHATVPLSSRLEPDLQIWPYVEQILHLPWFYATMVHTCNDVELREMLLISDVLTLESLQQRRSPGRVEEILLVSPGPMNGRGRWLMEPLRQIHYVPCSPLGRSHYCYVVDGGRSYTNDCDPGLEAEYSSRGRVVVTLDNSAVP